MYTKQGLIFLLIVTLGIASCSKQSDDPNILINIENEFTVSMIETLDSGLNELMLRVVTIDLLECRNYEIVHSISTSNNEVVASIDNIREPEDCVTGLMAASSDINVGILENGSYLFQLNLEKGSILNEGTLSVDDKGYSIELDSEHGIDFAEKQMSKLPDGYIWGEINIAAGAGDNVSENLFDDLAQITNSSDLAPGNYGHFHIENNLNIRFNSEKIYSFDSVEKTSFILYLSGTKADLQSILEEYRSNFEGKIDIELITSEGEHF